MSNKELTQNVPFNEGVPILVFADSSKLEEMKKHHNAEEWLECSEVFGSCTCPVKRVLVRLSDDGRITCPKYKQMPFPFCSNCDSYKAHKPMSSRFVGGNWIGDGRCKIGANPSHEYTTVEGECCEKHTYARGKQN